LSLYIYANPITPEQLQILKEVGLKKEIKKSIPSTKEPEVISNHIKQSNTDSVPPPSKKRHTDDENLNKNQQKEIKLRRYGEQFFNNKNTLNPYSVPTPSSYILNRGDKLSLNIYGAENKEFELEVNRYGNITIPRIGDILILGLSFKDAKSKVIKECQKAYPNSTNILLSITKLTPIQITVAGLVNAPGLYNLSSFSTIKDALIAVGGILPNGSFRNIELRRNGKTYSIFDLYALIRFGDASMDTLLSNGDVVFVPSIQKEITLKGAVHMPAIYELKKDETFQDLINYSSGTSAQANKNGLMLKRFLKNEKISVFSLSLKELYKYEPKNGDIVEIFAMSERSGKFVKVIGNVVAPGDKELPSDMKLSTLLKRELKDFGEKGFFEDNTNFKYALVKNDNISKSFNLSRVLKSYEDILLNSGDVIHIFKKTSFQKQPFIYAKGSVVDPSKVKYDYTDGMKIRDLFSIVKFTYENDNGEILIPDKSKVQVKRVENGKKVVYTKKIPLQGGFRLKQYDEITFFEYTTTHDESKVTIRGEVFIPGSYDIKGYISINNLIRTAGGLTKKALMNKFEVARYTTIDNKRVRHIITTSLKLALDKKMMILPDDEVIIMAISNWNKKQYIELSGQVKFPGRYAIEPGERLASVIKRAGGFANNAFIEGAVFTREDVRRLQEEHIKESLERLKIKMLQLNSSATDIGENPEEKQRVVGVIKELEAKASSIKPIGRISIYLSYDLKRFMNSPYNITLRDKDKLHIPTISDTVTVVGEILNQNTFVYNNLLSTSDYIDKAGGFTNIADQNHVYIVKANGEAVKYKQHYFLGSGNSIFKGDTIVVPMKIDSISNIKIAKDITSIIYQMAITVASLHTVGAL
jgi:protein involved in polysaccharide export with SLBB domain